MAGDHLKNDEKAAVATYLRHIPEAMVPTFTGVIVACSISGISGACDSVRVRHAGRRAQAPRAAAFIPLAYTMIPDGGAFLLALLMNVSFASSQLSPTHICTAIISDYFGVTFFATVKKLLPLFLLTVLIACGYYMLLTAVF